jgi:uncharacterized protein YjeT (DUF2065 family)
MNPLIRCPFRLDALDDASATPGAARPAAEETLPFVTAEQDWDSSFIRKVGVFVVVVGFVVVYVRMRSSKSDANVKHG